MPFNCAKFGMNLVSMAVIFILSALNSSVASSTAPAHRGNLQWPLHFERNEGQFAADWAYAARGANAMLAVRSDDILLALRPASANPETGAFAPARQFSLRFLGGQTFISVAGEREARGKVNYYLGNDPTEWHTGIPTFESVRAREVYPGIDVIVYGNPSDAEFDWEVAPGADPGLIRWTFADEYGLPLQPMLTADGGLMWQSDDGEILQRRPVAWQIIDGETIPVESRFILGADRSAQIALGAYDPAHTLIIDPILFYSTYFGGTFSDTADAIAVDFEGNIFIAGQTFSADLPLNPPNNDTFFGNAFVAKFDPVDNIVEFITVFGGGSFEFVHDIAFTGNDVYVAGSTSSSDFPTQNAFQAASRGDGEGFVFRVNSEDFTLQNSTYFGSGIADTGQSSATDNVLSIDVNGELNIVYICGTTTGSDLWLQNELFGNQSGMDGYAAVLGQGGETLLFSTYLGGAAIDQARAIRYNFNSNSIYVAGTTGSGIDPGQFPLLNATQPLFGGGTTDAFVSIIELNTPALTFSTFVGGSGSDSANDLEITMFDEAVVVGETSSADFPLLNSVFPAPPSPGANGFMTIIDVFQQPPFVFSSSTIGGSQTDSILRVALGLAPDESQNYFLLCSADSEDFPTLNAYQRSIGNPGQVLRDAALVKAADDGETFAYSTFLGGERADNAKGLAVSEFGDAYISGWTESLNFPTIFPFQASKQSPQNNTSDAFISVFEDPPAIAAFDPPRITHAILADENFNNMGDADEVLILQFDRAILVNPGLVSSDSFYLPVVGDSLGDSILFEINEFNARQLLITLGPNARLSVPGEVNPQDGQSTASGIDLRAALVPTAITSVVGVPAVNSGNPAFDDSAIDLKVVFFPTTVNIGAASPDPFVVVPTSSSDAALTRTRLVFPPNSIANTDVTLRPANIDPRVPYAVEIEVGIELFTTGQPMTLFVEYLEHEADFDNGYVERGFRLFQFMPLGPSDFEWLDVTFEPQQVFVHRNTVVIQINQIDPPIPVGASVIEGPGSSRGIFGNIPGETIESASLFIKKITGAAAAGPAPRITLVPPPSIRPGSGGHYIFHEVEFPGYDQTTPDDPDRIRIVMRKPNLFDLATLDDFDQGFPLDSSALFVIEASDASNQDVQFFDPVNITVQFFDGADGNYNDIFMFGDSPGSVNTMALVNDTYYGFGVNFQFNAVPGSVTTFPGGGTLEALSVSGLTDFDGVGIWGAVSTGLTPTPPDTWIMH